MKNNRKWVRVFAVLIVLSVGYNLLCSVAPKETSPDKHLFIQIWGYFILLLGITGFAAWIKNNYFPKQA